MTIPIDQRAFETRRHPGPTLSVDNYLIRFNRHLWHRGAIGHLVCEYDVEVLLEFR